MDLQKIQSECLFSQVAHSVIANQLTMDLQKIQSECLFSQVAHSVIANQLSVLRQLLNLLHQLLDESQLLGGMINKKNKSVLDQPHPQAFLIFFLLSAKNDWKTGSEQKGASGSR